MNHYSILFFLGYILRLESVLLLPSLLIALFNGETAAARALACTILLAAGLSLLALLCRGKDRSIAHREGFVIVALSWVVMSLVGALPFTLSGAIPSYLDAFFETVSGFTTTGASILTNVEALPMSLLYWRSFTHWLGGMGILVFVLAIVPLAKGKGDSLHVLRAESPGPSVGKLAPTMRRSARLLYAIYIGLTLIEMVLLLLGGMPLFDALVNSFATAGTGGFAIKNASIAAYESYYLQGVIGVFMVLFGVNFNLYYLILIGKARQALRSEELRVYLGLVGVSTLVIALNIRGLYNSLFDAFHYSFFQVASIITTTGFATADFDLWPQLSRCILLVLMVAGACAGSTGGGIKTARVILLWKSVKSSVQKMLHPRSVKVIKMDDKPVEAEVLEGTQTFMVVYSLIAVASILLVALDNFDFETTFSAVLACLNNIGPGLSVVGPTSNYSALSPLSKLVLTADILLGRLEIFPMLLLFAPSVRRVRSRRI